MDQAGFVYLAPQAARNSWYPYSFLAPISSNEPGLSSGLAVIEYVLVQVTEAGIPLERTMLLGFSQGACLTLEFVARHARRYGGVAGLSGGLIGPDDTPRDYPGSLEGTPVFLGCSDIDPHIPKERVELSSGLSHATPLPHPPEERRALDGWKAYATTASGSTMIHQAQRWLCSEGEAFRQPGKEPERENPVTHQNACP